MQVFYRFTVCYTKDIITICFYNQERIIMLGVSDIVKDSVVEFSRLQNWMLSARENNDTNTYNMMLDRYIELKVILSAAGVNITELDKIKN